MPVNAKPILLFDNVFEDGTPTATDTASGYDVLNLIDWRNYTYWKAASAGTKHLTVDRCLITNAGFETGDGTEWTLSNATVVSTDPHSGTYHAQLVASGSYVNGPAQQVTVDPTKTYKVKVNTKVAARSGGTFYAAYRCYDEDGNGLNWIAFYTVQSITPVYVESSFTIGPAGSGATYEFLPGTKTLGLTFKWDDTPTGTAYIDDCVIYEVSGADTLAILEHNLWSANAMVSVEYSDDSTEVISSWTEALAGFTPDDNKALMKTFTEQQVRAWRLKLVTTYIAPYVAVAVLGDRLTMERYPSGNFDPGNEKIHARSNISKGGNPLGSVIEYYEKKLTLDFKNITPSWIDSTFEPAWQNHLRNLIPCFIAWDITNHGDEIYFGKVPDNADLKMPYDPVRRSINLEFDCVVEI